MSPLKHYTGQLLPGAQDIQNAMMDKLRDNLNAELLAQGVLPTAAALAVAEAAVDNPKEPTAVVEPEPPEPRQYHISTYLTAFPNGTFGVHMHSDSFTAEGNGDHPEEAVLLAMHKLWTQMDRPRCPHCGQVMPEEAGK